MFKPDALEAGPIVNRMLINLLCWVPTRGRSGSDLRSAAGSVIARSEALCQQNMIGPPLANCFDLARLAGVTMQQLAIVRAGVDAEAPVLLGAVLVKNASVGLCLATEARILAGTTFSARDDVDNVKRVFNAAFNQVEETAADQMDQMSYQAAVRLHSAIIYYLVETARPLPRMLGYRFAQPVPSLLGAYRLYDDAARGDELRAENHIVHPAFMPATGRALSA